MSTTKYVVVESTTVFIGAIQSLGGPDNVVRLRFESRDGQPSILGSVDKGTGWVVLEGVALKLEDNDVGPTIRLWWRHPDDDTPCTMDTIHNVVELYNGRWSHYTASGISNTGVGGTRSDGDLEIIGNRGARVKNIILSSMMDKGTKEFYEQLP